MEKEGNPSQQSHSNSNLYSCLGSLVLSSILVLLLLFSLFFFLFPLSESSSWPVLLTVPIVLLSTLFLLRKKKGSEEDIESLLVQEKMQKEELQLQLTEIALIHEQLAEPQSDSSYPSDSESTDGSAMDEKLELNPKNTSSLPSDAATESINGDDETESFELEQNSTRVLGIYESLASDNGDEEEEEDEDDDDDDDDLIEINLPSSHFSGIGKELGQRLESKLPDFLPEAMFKQEGLMELLAEINEMNEDENLIEIDISMGSSNDLRLNQEMPILSRSV